MKENISPFGSGHSPSDAARGRGKCAGFGTSRRTRRRGFDNRCGMRLRLPATEPRTAPEHLTTNDHIATRKFYMPGETPRPRPAPTGCLSSNRSQRQITTSGDGRNRLSVMRAEWCRGLLSHALLCGLHCSRRPPRSSAAYILEYNA
jgi:hypothetical protein